MQDLTQTGREVSLSWSLFYSYIAGISYRGRKNSSFWLFLDFPISQSQALLPTYMPMPISPSLCQGRKEERKKKPRGLYPLIKHSPTLQAREPGGSSLHHWPQARHLSAYNGTSGFRLGLPGAPAGNQLHRDDRGHLEQWNPETANHPSHHLTLRTIFIYIEF